MQLPQTHKGYVAGEAGYMYPALGHPRPPVGAKVLLLTEGAVCISGIWSDDGRYMAWSPLPREEDYTYPARGGAQPSSGEKLLLTEGGICVFGPWINDGRFLGWVEKPARNLDSEQALKRAMRRVGA
ncbi:hypothetical protein ABIC83_003045 [Roseateles asaccharophilus]|uniref:hypothetical protein n=1 Tax=Roseateles asaccharophilus TaxID=582607 RepID=UPI00383703DE